MWRSETSSTRVILECNSLQEYLSEVTTRWKQHHYDTSSQEETYDKQWVLFPTYQEWDDVVRKGTHSEEIEKLMRIFDKEIRNLRVLFNFSEGESNLFRDGFDYEGYAVNVDRFLQGEPECFWNTNKPINELIDIYVTGAIHCFVDAQQKAKDTAMVAKLVYLLKLKGCNARIFNCDSSTYSACKIKIKDYRDTLDIRSLLINLLPDFHRRYVFQQIELDPSVGPGYGRTEKEMWLLWRNSFNPNVMTIDLLAADHVGITDDLLTKVAKERDIKKIVEMVNKRY